MMKNLTLVLALTLFTPLVALRAEKAAAPAPEPQFNTVFQHGEDGWPDYRIPALLATRHGVLLAFAEGRQSLSDHSANDIVLKRSTDGGRTWGKLQLVHEAGADVLVNPCAVSLDSGRVLLMYQWLGAGYHSRDMDGGIKRALPGFTGGQVEHNFVRWSDDDGATWSPARDVTAETKRPAPITSIAIGPGIGIQLQHSHRGRILFPAGESSGPGARAPHNTAYACISDDGGTTWHCGQPVPGESGLGTEVQMAELPDGSILLNDRSSDKGHFRKSALSHDGGETWSAAHNETQLPESECMATLLRYSWPDHGGSRLLFANPAVTQGRANGTLRLSLDEGKTWAVSKTVWPGSYAYSSLARLSDGTIGLLFEANGCHEIKFARIPLAWLTAE